MSPCRQCGAGLADGAHVCSRCGARSQSEVSDETVAIPMSAATLAAAAGASAVQPGAAPERGGSSSPSFASNPTADEGRFLPGTLIAGRYRMIELLGRGGMGEVYRATDLTLAQSVALKFLPNAAENHRLLERFHSEVRIARQVSHPNVCRVYDIGEADRMPFISMEYVDGEDLGSLLHRIGRLPSDKALEIARKLCAGLAAAHERGIIHRDLKPQNIMLDRRGEVVIMDFGLAAIADELRGLEARDGTPAYMAPEQLRGDAVTARSDIYALGLILYELFSGKRAFEAHTLAELIQQQEARTPVSLCALVTDVDPGIERVILRCLDPNPARRPATALAVAAALPGGDPLAAALAAGEMPSPELVAASGASHGIAARYAIPCLALILVAVLSAPFIKERMGLALISVAPPELPPPVLEQTAREMAEALGHKPVLRDCYTEFGTQTELLNFLRDRDQKAKDWRKLLHAESPYKFIYRQSPHLLLSPPDGSITLERPGLNVPGMLTIITDGRGRLRSFEAVASANERPVTEAIEAAAIFKAAGLDITKFSEAEPKRVPVLAFDKRQAWSGMAPGLNDVPIRMEVASWQGRPVSIQVVWPFSKEPDAESTKPDFAAIIAQIVSVVLLTCGVLCAVYFANQNLKRGRGDRNGALKLALLLAGGLTLRFLLTMHYLPSLDIIPYLFTNLAYVMAVGVLVWVAYIALEPMVRSVWPESLITWNRVLGGHFADPRVCSQVLTGAAAGMVLHSALLWKIHWRVRTGGLPSGFDGSALDSTSHVLAAVLQVLCQATLTSLVIFFMLCGLKALLRRDWLAALVAALVMTAQQQALGDLGTLWLDVPLYIVIFGVFALMLLRWGMVPAIAGVVFINLTSQVSIVPDFLSWVNGPAVTFLVLLVSTALLAFWRSQAKPETTTAFS